MLLGNNLQYWNLLLCQRKRPCQRNIFHFVFWHLKVSLKYLICILDYNNEYNIFDMLISSCFQALWKISTHDVVKDIYLNMIINVSDVAKIILSNILTMIETFERTQIKTIKDWIWNSLTTVLIWMYKHHLWSSVQFQILLTRIQRSRLVKHGSQIQSLIY